MSYELKKRIATSLILLSLLTIMYFYTFIMIISLIVIAMIVWIEFYALISKILKKNTFKYRFLRFLYKSISLLYLSALVYFIFSIESNYPNFKPYLYRVPSLANQSPSIKISLCRIPFSFCKAL